MAADESGAELVRAAVDRFYDRMLADPRLADFFAGVDLDRLRAHQRAFVTAALVGGDLYAGQRMRPAHAGLGIDDAAFDAAVEHLASAMSESGASADAVQRLRLRIQPIRPLVVAS